MGGVIGALSTKMVFATGALLFASRIDMQRTPATIDPSLPMTTITESLAQWIGGAAGARRRTVDIGSSTIRISDVGIVGWAEPPMTVGADVLHEIALLTDLRRMRLQVMDDSQLRRASRGRMPIATRIGSDRCVTVEVTGVDGKPMQAALLSDMSGEGAITVTLGGLKLAAAPLPAGRCATSGVALSWSSFVGKAVLLDLGHNRLWIW